MTCYWRRFCDINAIKSSRRLQYFSSRFEMRFTTTGCKHRLAEMKWQLGTYFNDQIGNSIHPALSKLTRQQDNSHYVDGLGQDCSISSALAIEILQPCAKPSIYNILRLSGGVVVTAVSPSAHDNCFFGPPKWSQGSTSYNMSRTCFLFGTVIDCTIF